MRTLHTPTTHRDSIAFLSHAKQVHLARRLGLWTAYRTKWFLVPAVLFLVILLIPVDGFAAAQGPHDANHGSIWIKMADGGGYSETMPLGTAVDMQISGLVNRVHVRQSFLNNTQLWAEAVYVFPLPDNAAVDHLTLYVDGRVIEGQIQERKKAKEIYEQARVDGKTAGLVEQYRPNVFSVAIANVGPGERIVVEIDYIETLQYRDDSYSLLFPLSISPRFGDECSANNSCDGSADRPVTVSIDLDPGFGLASLLSPSHDIDIEEAGQRYRVTMTSEAVAQWRDFSLRWSGAVGSTPDVAVYRESVDGEDYGLLMIMPPRVEISAFDSVPRDLTLVIDVSGSMQGESLENAKDAVVMAIQALRPSDTFNVITFSDRAHWLSSTPIAVTPSNVEEAIGTVSRIKSEGGTNMLPAIKMAFKNPAHGDYLRQVVFLTDGGVGDEESLFSAIQDGLNDRRLFTVGIGPAPNAYFMRKAARAGRGTFTFISDTSEVEAKMSALLDRLSSPVVTDLTLESSHGTIEILPNPLPDLYLGDPLVAVWSGEAFDQPLRLSGVIDGIAWEQSIDIDAASSREGIAKTWARIKLDQLEEIHREANVESDWKQLEADMTELAIRHQLMSAYTSFVAVDITPRRAGGMMEHHNKSEDLNPKFLAGLKSTQGYGINLPQTATSAPLRTLYGLVLMTLALLLVRISRRGLSCADWD